MVVSRQGTFPSNWKRRARARCIVYVVAGERLRNELGIDICDDSRVQKFALICAVDPSLPEIVKSVESSRMNTSILLLNIMRRDCNVEYGVLWLVLIIINDGGVT